MSTTEQAPIVAVVDDSKPAEQVPYDDPHAPKVGRWYWVQRAANGYDESEQWVTAERWFGCVTHIGSNYVELKGPMGWETRVHVDEFWDTCEFVEEPDKYILDQVNENQGAVRELMMQVHAVTARLAIATGPMLNAAPSEASALAVHTGQAMDAYKTALVKAKDETLPELFKKIKNRNIRLGKWMKASLIPMEAQAESLKPAIGAIKDRIFSVSLYAGLVEDVEQIADGEPASLTEKIRVFQRRAYMDEECLAEYETGGMEFKKLKAFDRWLLKRANRERLLPFPRCIVAFQVRRKEKERAVYSVASFVRMMEDRELDKLTFLYIRNGEQVFRLNTEIDFGAQLFPDLDRRKLDGELYAYRFTSEFEKLITGDEWRAIVEQEIEDAHLAKTAPKAERWKYEHRAHFRDSDKYVHFTRDSVYYDDIANFIQKEIARHNRLVLVLQGLLDRSLVLHPHPPWQLWNGDSFGQALDLIYDDSRSMTTGDAPDFEAYRAKCNESIKVGSITVGQEDAWERFEATKESARRGHRGDYHPERYRPYGNPGPGKLARAAHTTSTKCTYKWTRERQKRGYDDDRDDRNSELACSFTTSRDKLLNVSAYKPGDFKIFFNDPRTRADYLEWAWLLLEAEEYHAGNRKVAALKEMPKRVRTEEGARRYRLGKERKALVGKAVRLNRDVTMKSKHVHKKGTLWRVRGVERGGTFWINGCNEDGTRDFKGDRAISNISSWSFIVDTSIPDEPKKKDE